VNPLKEAGFKTMSPVELAWGESAKDSSQLEQLVAKIAPEGHVENFARLASGELPSFAASKV